MILFDGVIESIQGCGGISVYFNEIVKRCQKKQSITYLKYDEHGYLNISDEVSELRLLRFLERYRDVSCAKNTMLFHSSYYRLPSTRVPTVTTVHDFTYEKFVNGPAKWVHCWQKYRAIKNSDIVICVSHNTAKDLMQYCPIEPNKIRVVHNGVSEAYYPITNMKNVTNEVLFVGARTGYKNFVLAIDALAKLPEYVLSIVGGGELTKNEKALLESRIPGRYTWLGRLSDADLNLAYNRAHALLYPSSYEGFGIPVIEAMRSGCPVVAVNVSSIPEVAGNAAILTEYADAKLFKEALLKVSETREELINAGLEQAVKFSWDKCFQETLQVYEELM
ncbi:glycosyltransferase family 4 protein [Vibrio vulnificus]|nr:glycosyltransferase family 4 protein [Vibrio vulnificus]EHK8976419.1 glycosyltransferase family 4 protein [Vibrio vulnificus]EME0812067.1 glycosyltransferase family 4 protein [Vibrio vulnificus]